MQGTMSRVYTSVAWLSRDQWHGRPSVLCGSTYTDIMVVRVSHKVLLELAIVGGEGDGKVLLVDWVHEYAAKN